MNDTSITSASTATRYVRVCGGDTTFSSTRSHPQLTLPLSFFPSLKSHSKPAPTEPTSPTHSPTFQTLPTELIIHTVHFLDSRSARSLSKTCRQLRRMITCKLVHTIEDAEIQSRFEEELRGAEDEIQKARIKYRQEWKVLRVRVRRICFPIWLVEMMGLMGREG
jgi:hypothetical protein